MHPAYAVTFNNIGATYIKKALYKKALQYFLKGL